MYKNYISIAYLFLTCLFAAPVNRNGTTALNFLEIDIGSAGSALGGAYVSVVDDATACYWNPAGLTGSQRSNIIFMHQPWLLDIEHYFIATSANLGRGGYIGIALNYMNYGDEEVTTVQFPDGTNEFYSANDYSLSFSYAKRIVDWFSFGATLKYLSSNVWHLSGKAVAMDLGVLINSHFFARGDDRNTGMRIGMSISNFGSKIKYDGIDLLNSIDISDDNGNFANVPGQYKMSSWELPLIFRIGASIAPLNNSFNKLQFSADMLHPNNNAESINLGVEYTQKFRNLAEIYFRLGTKIISDIKVGNECVFDKGELDNGIDNVVDCNDIDGTWHSEETIKLSEVENTIGGGLKLRIQGLNTIKIDYCYKNIGILGNVHLYTIGIDF